MKKSKGFFKFYILLGYPTRIQFCIQKTKSSSSSPEKTFYMQKAKRSSSTSFHPTRHSKGIPDIPVIHDIQPLQAILHASRESFLILQIPQILQHSPIRMHILHIGWFPQKLHRVPVETLQTFYKLSFFKEREMLRYRSKHISVRCQDDIKFKNRINPSIVLSSRVTN